MAVILESTVGTVRSMASAQETIRDVRTYPPAWTNPTDFTTTAMWDNEASSAVADHPDHSEMPQVVWKSESVQPFYLIVPAVGTSTSTWHAPDTIGSTLIRWMNVATFSLAGVALFGLLLILSGVHLLDKVAERTTVDAIVLFGAVIVSLAAVAWILVAGLMIVIMVSIMLRHSTVWTKWRRRQAKSA